MRHTTTPTTTTPRTTNAASRPKAARACTLTIAVAVPDVEPGRRQVQRIDRFSGEVQVIADMFGRMCPDPELPRNRARDEPATPRIPQHVIDSIDGARGDVETSTEAMRWIPPELLPSPVRT